MEKNRNRLADHLIISLHTYLAIGVIAIVTALVFYFYDFYWSSVGDFRNHQLALTVQYRMPGFDNILHEKIENLSYVLSALSAAAIVFISMFFAQKYFVPWLQKRSEKNLFSAVNFFSILSILLLAWYAPILSFQISVFPQNLNPTWNALVILLGIFAANLAIAYEKFRKQSLDFVIKIIYFLLALALSLLISSYLVFDENYPEMLEYAMNFNPIAYPVVQQYLGKELLINLKSLYGLHPYFLQAVFYIFPATILTLTTTLAALLVISTLSLAFFIFSIIENKFLALIGFLAVLFVQNFAVDGRFLESGIAFQYEPIRLLFPSLLLGFLYFFCKNPDAKKYYFGLIFFSVATMWNLDVGLPSFLTLAIVMGHEKLKDDFKIRVALIHLAKSLAILSLSWMALILFLKLKYDQWPNLFWISYGQKAAFNFAYAMLPITKIGAWCSLLIIYAIGLAFSINNFLTKKHSLQNSLMLALTLLGIGLFTYFIGRSHVVNVTHCAYPAIILLIIFADKCCRNLIRKNFDSIFLNTRFDLLLMIIPLLFISYFSSVFIFEIFTNKTLKEKFITTKFTQKTKPHWITESEFIKKHVNSDEAFIREDILMINLEDHDYYLDLDLRIKSPLNVANIRHMFFQNELDDLRNLIAKKEKRWVILIESESLKMMPLFSKRELEDLQKLVSKNYSINSKMTVGQGGVTIFEKRDTSKSSL